MDDYDELHLDFARRAIDATMKRLPKLTTIGFTDRGHEEFASRRSDLANEVAGFLAARCWLAPLTPTARVTTQDGYNTYALKQRAEYQFRAYISNGAFIAAADHLGFNLLTSNPNGLIGIKRSADFRKALAAGFF